MPEGKSEHRPGDVILDRYMPKASSEERAAARETLRAFATVILRICTRLTDEQRDASTRANHERAVESE